MGIAASVRTRLSQFNTRIEAIIIRNPRFYTGFVLLIALTGYALVLLFPILVLAAGLNISEILLSSEAIDWVGAAIWSVVLLVSALLSYRGWQIKISAPVGLTLAEEKAPELFKLMQQYRSHFKRPAIHRVVITANYELDIIKLPKWALPIWSTNVLIIGLPVLLCLTPKQFECLLARRMGQFSKRHNPISNWLYQLRPIWKQYSQAYGKQPYPDSYLLKLFYAGYAALYSSVSVYVARRDELYADTYAMELFTHEDVREMITAETTYQLYLEKRFWPAINKIAAADTKHALTPYQNIAASIHTNLEEKKLTSLTHLALKAEPGRKDAKPSLKQRLENVGHDAPYMAEASGQTAAGKYLGAALNNVIKLIDTLWLKDHMSRQKLSKK